MNARDFAAPSWISPVVPDYFQMIGNQIGPTSDVKCVGHAGSGRLRGSREQALVNSPGNINPYNLLVYSLHIIVCGLQLHA